MACLLFHAVLSLISPACSSCCVMVPLALLASVRLLRLVLCWGEAAEVVKNAAGCSCLLPRDAGFAADDELVVAVETLMLAGEAAMTSQHQQFCAVSASVSVRV